MMVMGLAAMAQPTREERERIKTLQIAYITQKVKLTPAQAEKFWPVYNAYEREKLQLRKEYGEKYLAEHPSSTRMDAREAVNANIEFKEQELALLKRYKDELLKTISEEQLAELYKAEAGFRQMLIQELGKRRGNMQGRRPPMRR